MKLKHSDLISYTILQLLESLSLSLSIVYFPPYILAFTADTIEIRMISNGSLIQSIDALDLKLISQKVRNTRKLLIH